MFKSIPRAYSLGHLVFQLFSSALFWTPCHTGFSAVSETQQAHPTSDPLPVQLHYQESTWHSPRAQLLHKPDVSS